jgi:hypothetical protein
MAQGHDAERVEDRLVQVLERRKRVKTVLDQKVAVLFQVKAAQESKHQGHVVLPFVCWWWDLCLLMLLNTWPWWWWHHLLGKRDCVCRVWEDGGSVGDESDRGSRLFAHYHTQHSRCKVFIH